MKMIANLKVGLRNAQFSYNLTFRYFILLALIAIGVLAPIRAQDSVRYARPTWYFGLAAGANLNFYRGTTQELTSSFTVPKAFRHGDGIGLYLAPTLEYYRPNTRLGGMLQIGYDNRSGNFESVVTPCNCVANLSSSLSYVTIEPSLRFSPFKSNFYLFGGPRLAFNISKSFTYSQKTNPEFPAQVANADISGDFSGARSLLLSMQVGVGYDIQLTSQEKQTQFVLSPFVAFQPYFGQDPRSIETWTVTTLRVGAALKLGRGKLIKAPNEKVQAVQPGVTFTVNSPENIPVERRVRETFPLRNYVFFNTGSTEIPDRYVLLSKDQVKDFKEDQLEVFTPKKLSGRSKREMVVYYNILNILGDRMGKNPSSTITLVGSSPKGIEDGKAMSASIKKYLTSVFSIDPSRINLEGGKKPKIPSEQPGAKLELVLLREGDHRVSIESGSPSLLMEFQSGPSAPLKAVEFVAVQEAPLDSYVTFKVDGADKAFHSWSMEMKDEAGVVQNFGPYQQEKVSIPGKSILGTRPKGDYKVTMIGKAKNGDLVRKEASVHMVLWVPEQNEEGLRYSVIYEFNNSRAIAMYDKYLTEIVTPKIPRNGTVIIHGYTDIIGEEAHNLELSQARANDVKRIIERALSKAGRSDVKFEVYGFGEDQSLAPFENNLPEERFYNRTVVIDIISKKIK